MDINEKLRRLTPEQAKALGASLNSCYPDKKKPATATNTKKKPATAKKGKK